MKFHEFRSIKIFGTEMGRYRALCDDHHHYLYEVLRIAVFMPNIKRYCSAASYVYPIGLPQLQYHCTRIQGITPPEFLKPRISEFNARTYHVDTKIPPCFRYARESCYYAVVNGFMLSFAPEIKQEDNWWNGVPAFAKVGAAVVIFNYPSNQNFLAYSTLFSFYKSQMHLVIAMKRSEVIQRFLC